MDHLMYQYSPLCVYFTSQFLSQFSCSVHSFFLYIEKPDSLILMWKYEMQYRSEISEPKHTRNTRMPIYVYAYADTRIRLCLYAYTRIQSVHVCSLVFISYVAYCCFLCNTVVKCCFNGLVIL